MPIDKTYIDLNIALWEIEAFIDCMIQETLDTLRFTPPQIIPHGLGLFCDSCGRNLDGCAFQITEPGKCHQPECGTVYWWEGFYTCTCGYKHYYGDQSA